MRILAIDLGNTHSVACVYEVTTGEHHFKRVRSKPEDLRELLTRTQPDRLVIEISPLAGWIRDLARELGIELQAAVTTGQAWRWRNTKRKTDRDDAIKLARLSAVNQIRCAHVPDRPVREWRSLIAYRHSLVARRTQCQKCA